VTQFEATILSSPSHRFVLVLLVSLLLGLESFCLVLGVVVCSCTNSVSFHEKQGGAMLVNILEAIDKSLERLEEALNRV